MEDQVVTELRNQTAWLRLLGLQTLRPLLESTLVGHKQKLVYELSNGSRSQRDVARKAGVGAATVFRWWQDWLALGICVEAADKPGRACHLASLSRLGIELPRGQAVARPTLVQDDGDG
jgi:hypothetical protein